MGLFDSYFDPEQFQDSGGLLGRLLSLQPQQGQYQPAPGFNAQSDIARAPAQPAAIPMPVPRPAMPQAPDAGETIAIGDYQMPQFTGASAPQTAQQQPALGDRLSAGFQSWAHTPPGNPVAGLANAMAGFSSGQRADPGGVAASQMPSQAQAQLPDLGDRLSSGFQSWAHTPVGNPFAAIANGVSGFNSGQRSDPAAVAQQILKSPVDTVGNPQPDLHARYQALRPIIGDRNAMLAVVHPEVAQLPIMQALADQTGSGNSGAMDPAGGDRSASGNDTNPTAVGQSPGPASTVAAGNPPGYAPRGGHRGTMASQSNVPGPLVRSVAEAKMRKRGLPK
jgi:hypothetical protein